MRIGLILLTLAMMSACMFAAEPATKPADTVLSKPIRRIEFKNLALADALDMIGTSSGARSLQTGAR
jgi:hypothetical protein